MVGAAKSCRSLALIGVYATCPWIGTIFDRIYSFCAASIRDMKGWPGISAFGRCGIRAERNGEEGAAKERRRRKGGGRTGYGCGRRPCRRWLLRGLAAWTADDLEEAGRNGRLFEVERARSALTTAVENC